MFITPENMNVLDRTYNRMMVKLSLSLTKVGQILHTLYVNITYSVLAEVYLYHTFGELAATIRICCAGQTTN